MADRLFVPAVIAFLAGALTFTATLLIVLYVALTAPSPTVATLNDVDPYLWVLVGTSPAILWVFASLVLYGFGRVAGSRHSLRATAVVTGWGMAPMVAANGFILLWTAVSLLLGQPILRDVTASELFGGVPVFFESPFVLVVYVLGLVWAAYIWYVGLQVREILPTSLAQRAVLVAVGGWVSVRLALVFLTLL
jgi:hypothetical protein